MLNGQKMKWCVSCGNFAENMLNRFFADLKTQVQSRAAASTSSKPSLSTEQNILKPQVLPLNIL